MQDLPHTHSKHPTCKVTQTTGLQSIDGPCLVTHGNIMFQSGLVDNTSEPLVEGGSPDEVELSPAPPVGEAAEKNASPDPMDTT